MLESSSIGKAIAKLIAFVMTSGIMVTITYNLMLIGNAEYYSKHPDLLHRAC